MNIGIDIDGCINQYYKDFYKYVLKTYNIEIDITKYENYKFLMKTLGMEEFNNLSKNFTVNDANIEFLASFIINKLYKKHNIYILTARSYAMASETIKWLKKHKILYNDILFSCGNKNDACKYKKIDYMIEDCPYNIYSLIKDNIKTIVFERPYNKDEFYNGNMIYIAKNWIDIYNYLNKKNT